MNEKKYCFTIITRLDRLIYSIIITKMKPSFIHSCFKLIQYVNIVYYIRKRIHYIITNSSILSSLYTDSICVNQNLQVIRFYRLHNIYKLIHIKLPFTHYNRTHITHSIYIELGNFFEVNQNISLFTIIIQTPNPQYLFHI